MAVKPKFQPGGCFEFRVSDFDHLQLCTLQVPRLCYTHSDLDCHAEARTYAICLHLVLSDRRRTVGRTRRLRCHSPALLANEAQGASIALPSILLLAKLTSVPRSPGHWWSPSSNHCLPIR